MKSKTLLFVVPLFIASLCSSSWGQTQADVERALSQAQVSGTTKLTPDQFQQKLKELGMSEEEARIRAKERGVNLDDYLTGGRTGGTRVQSGQPGAQGSVEIKVPVSAMEPSVAPEAKNIARDDSPAPTGPGGLPYFGYDIFKQMPAAFEPSANGPVDPGYLVGYGDVLRLTVWGQAEFQNELEVDREGKVLIPKVGQVFVVGTPLNKLQEKLKSVLSKYYSGLATNPPTVFMDVTIAKLRPLRVFVMGEVKQPGGYTISSYATVFNALYAIGGPLARGSLRNVRVIRDNHLVATVDLYDYLLRGDQTSDVRLQNNDIIFLPPRGKSVSIRGEVPRPAIYELKDTEDLRKLVSYAGGLLTTAYLDKAQIDRVRPFEQRKKDAVDRIVVDINLGRVMKIGGSDAALYDGDQVEVLSILDEKKNYVTIEGPVRRPGRYELGEIKTLRDLLKAAEGVLPHTYLDRAHLIRLNEDKITTRLIQFNLGDLMNKPAADISLAPKDQIKIYGTEVTEVKKKTVSIFGHVKLPGAYEMRDDMTLTDLILNAGGFTEDADLLQAEIARVPPDGLKGDSVAMILHLKLSDGFAYAQLADPPGKSSPVASLTSDKFVLQHRDQVLIRPNPNYELQKNLTIEGDFTYPGVYAIRKRGERLSEILARAGGPTKTTYLEGAQYFRGGKRIIVDVRDVVMGKDKDNDVIVHERDRIVFPTKPHTVFVSGEVNNSGLFAYLEGDDVRDYIDRAGGLTDSASYAILTKPSGESRRVNFGFFSADPTVPDGSSIMVLRKPSEPPDDKKFDWSSTIKDTFAIVASAATIIYLVSQIKK